MYLVSVVTPGHFTVPAPPSDALSFRGAMARERRTPSIIERATLIPARLLLMHGQLTHRGAALGAGPRQRAARDL